MSANAVEWIDLSNISVASRLSTLLNVATDHIPFILVTAGNAVSMLNVTEVNYGKRNVCINDW